MKQSWILYFSLLASVHSFAQKSLRQWGIAVHPGYSQPLGSSHTTQGRRSWEAGIMVEEQYNAVWSFGVGLMYLNGGDQTPGNQLRWPSEFDQATGQYVKDPSLPHSSRYHFIFHSISLPLEVKCSVRPNGRWYFTSNVAPLLTFSNESKRVLRYDDGHTDNLSSKKQGGVGIGLSVGTGYTIPLAKRWKLDIRPALRILAPQLADAGTSGSLGAGRFTAAGVQILLMR